ncbi:amidase signature domain-containing protein [Kockovaella imperatae]|uniref:Amidase signature domain-containing protein n=1 Tax=Kockovaella imperatae TaxID=4999 RepID=A0A1Y1UPP7_9TREE|nr:amidase signature domain-containing protein [Kockovaella imperatae]ORX39547.1 amidase signature domain-containing protein [Kockovaella imperatae]
MPCQTGRVSWEKNISILGLVPGLHAAGSCVKGSRLARRRQIDLLSATIRDLQAYLSNGTITSLQLTQRYLDNIAANNHAGLELRAVIETGPYENLMAIAQYMDDLRANGTILSELHGIPMLLKDNIATDVSLGMNTTAGNYGFLGSQVPGDAPVTAQLRAKGVIVIGKANLSELANYKALNVTNGWSARGGQTQSAYVVGGFAAGGDPCGSSSGSAVGVSAGFSSASLGSETDGSLVCPANRAALYTIRMSVGLSSRTGVIPISSTQDTTGPMAKSTYDCALILENMVAHRPDPLDPYTKNGSLHALSNYTRFALHPHATFANKTLAVPIQFFQNETISGNPPEINMALNAAIARMAELGAIVINGTSVPSADQLATSTAETIVLDTDFKVDLATYLSRLSNSQIESLADLIDFDDAHADLEFAPGECCQEILVRSVQTTGRNATEYIHARATDYNIGRTNGIDYVLDKYQADALVLPTEGYASSLAAVAGYPIVSVPLGYLSNGQPFGMAFIGRQWSEATLISLMAAWEENSPPRRVPEQLV